MDKLINLLETELLEEADIIKGKEKLTNQDAPRINIMGGLAASYLALKDIKKSGRMPMRAEARAESWKDDIKEELESAETKYGQYKQFGDPVMLEMARQELSHANYYLNNAKMSTDEQLRGKLPVYQEHFDRLEKVISGPHGAEKMPVLA